MKDFREKLIESYRNPVGRRPATGRKLAIGRKPAVGRVPIGFLADGKIHVVLDTNIVVNALKHEENQTQKDCKYIIKLWKDGRFELGINGLLFEEYRLTGEALAKKGIIKVPLFNDLIRLIGEKAFSHRVRVEKQHVSKSYKDDHLFDGICADFLVSEDRKDVVCNKVMSAQAGYKNIVTASEFLACVV